jgi:nucleotide-binding universal stress UspA family protein
MTTPPIFAGFCPRTADPAPAQLAAVIARLTGVPLVVEAVYAGGTVMDEPWGGEYADQPAVDARAALERLRQHLGEGIDVTMLSREAVSPASGLSAAIAATGPSLVVLGSTRRGPIGRVLPGSTAERVIHGAPCPVLVVPRDHVAPDRLGTIGAAFAPTPEGREALRAAARLARATGADLRAITVLDPRLAERQSPGLLARQHHEDGVVDGDAARTRSAAEATLHDAIAELPDGVAAEPDVLFQDPADGLAAASGQLDLLVMGSRAYGPLRAVMLGGVSRRMISRAACPLLVLPRGVSDALEGLMPGAGAAPSVDR